MLPEAVDVELVSMSSESGSSFIEKSIFIELTSNFNRRNFSCSAIFNWANLCISTSYSFSLRLKVFKIKIKKKKYASHYLKINYYTNFNSLRNFICNRLNCVYTETYHRRLEVSYKYLVYKSLVTAEINT